MGYAIKSRKPQRFYFRVLSSSWPFSSSSRRPRCSSSIACSGELVNDINITREVLTFSSHFTLPLLLSLLQLPLYSLLSLHLFLLRLTHSVSPRVLLRDFFASKEHLHSRFRRPSIISWSRVDILQFLTERTDAMTCGRRPWNYVFCFSELEGNSIII